MPSHDPVPGGARGNQEFQRPQQQPLSLRQPQPRVLVSGVPGGRDLALLLRMHLHCGKAEKDRNHVCPGVQVVALSAQMESQGTITALSATTFFIFHDTLP